MKSLFRLVIIIVLVVIMPFGWAWKRSGEPMTYPPAAAEVPGMSLRELVEDRIQAEYELNTTGWTKNAKVVEWFGPYMGPQMIAAIMLMPYMFVYVPLGVYHEVQAEQLPVVEIPDIIWKQFEANFWEITVEVAEFSFAHRNWRRPIHTPDAAAASVPAAPGETTAHRECEFFLNADAQEPRYMLLSTDPVEVLQESTAERIQVNVTIERVGFTGEGWIDRDCLIEE